MDRDDSWYARTELGDSRSPSLNRSVSVSLSLSLSHTHTHTNLHTHTHTLSPSLSLTHRIAGWAVGGSRTQQSAKMLPGSPSPALSFQKRTCPRCELEPRMSTSGHLNFSPGSQLENVPQLEKGSSQKCKTVPRRTRIQGS